LHLLGDQVEISISPQGFGTTDSHFRPIGDLRPQIVPVPLGRGHDPVGFFSRIKEELNGTAGRLGKSVNFSPDFSHCVGVKPSGVMDPAFWQHHVFFLGKGHSAEKGKRSSKEEEQQEGPLHPTANQVPSGTSLSPCGRGAG